MRRLTRIGGRRRLGQGVAGITSDTGKFIFVVIVVFLLIGLAITFTDSGHDLACNLLNRISAQGLRFLIDPSGFGC